MGIIITRHEMPVIVIELVPLRVNYDLKVEGLIARLQGNPDITSAHFPKMTDKTRVVEERLFLLRLAPTRQPRPHDEVEKIVTAAGYSFAEWPSLGPIKEHADELWGAGILYVVACGPKSRWRGPVGTRVIYFDLYPGVPRFGLDRIEDGWIGNSWFLCHKFQPTAV